eukprot:1181222-Prorocentrum_minimum.AAC.1
MTCCTWGARRHRFHSPSVGSTCPRPIGRIVSRCSQAGSMFHKDSDVCSCPNTLRRRKTEPAPITEGDREYTRSGHQSQKGSENIPVVGTNHRRG